jgi:hypothetical protein
MFRFSFVNFTCVNKMARLRALLALFLALGWLTSAPLRATTESFLATSATAAAESETEAEPTAPLTALAPRHRRPAPRIAASCPVPRARTWPETSPSEPAPVYEPDALRIGQIRLRSPRAPPATT